MGICVARAFVAATCLVWLTGCESATKTSEFFRASASPEATASVPETKPASTAEAGTAEAGAASASAADTTGSLKGPVVVAPPPAPPVVAPPALAAVPPPYPLGPWSAAEDPYDDLALGKRHYREENYGLAELHF